MHGDAPQGMTLSPCSMRQWLRIRKAQIGSVAPVSGGIEQLSTWHDKCWLTSPVASGLDVLGWHPSLAYLKLPGCTSEPSA
eukprot:1631962-Amphidinium_carterae.1